MDSFDGLRSWGSRSSLADTQTVPSVDGFDEDCCGVPGLAKQSGSFRDYVLERSRLHEQGTPVIPAAVLAGFTGESCSFYQTTFV